MSYLRTIDIIRQDLNDDPALMAQEIAVLKRQYDEQKTMNDIELLRVMKERDTLRSALAEANKRLTAAKAKIATIDFHEINFDNRPSLEA